MDQPKEEQHTEEPQGEDTQQSEQQPQEGGEQPAQKKGSVLSAPQNYGNAAGEKIQGALGKVGDPVGKGLETAAKPVGGVIEPVVGGLFRAPEAFGHAADSDAKAKKQDEEDHRPIAGEEQTADNPLGLNQGGTK
uniref:Uncharacterized protein n=1 Tax=Cladonia uncialis subsp. uncialis TaxID=180999 RepID=A0A1Z1CJ63_CLAUC|nr:hypothetical protein [Cladonia uncialis subsp. uncialis]AUW31150.1 hypothetical protein [Cladonia uncialis subsp. uncialis]